ncbi:hypothetical protein XA68_11677 [Ophiocordyceps unilateralis]|uniref:Uncharacterized protein n=1 Tax=Ophiocordyceps unilateralis TaxID=268505 RepID=A0A2A9PF27_OPHUN|nr:hypothetical protein XA68_11677 [Ophiocordyceps unilateralis]
MEHRQAGLPRQSLVVSNEGRRPLFAAAPNAASASASASSSSSSSSNIRADPARRTKSDGSGGENLSPRETRIPRPSLQRRGKHKSMSEAFRIAKEEIGLVDGSPSPAPRPWRNSGSFQPDEKATTTPLDGVGLPDLVPGIEDMPLPSIEREPAPSPVKPITIAPPEKSFAWQIEDDFTAGDLQVSDSPRIKVGSNRPFAHRPSLVAGSRSPAKSTRPAWGSNQARADDKRKPMATRTNSKLEDIHAREKQHMSGDLDRAKPRPKNPKLDEIREREAKVPSKRAYAAGRLEEIHEQNFDSRSVSPQEAGSRTQMADTSSGEKIPNTPVTVFRGQRATDSISQDGSNEGASRKTSFDDAKADKKVVGDSRDLLRRLSRAASTSPGPEPQTPPPPPPPQPQPQPQPQPPRRRTREDGAKPTVSFTGLRRVDSTESAKSKTSTTHSEMDPTDRIDAEIRLFAPHENHSAQSSVRAPSPESESSSSGGLTPKPQRNEPASMPTPRITGAFVETPATVKVERADAWGDARAGRNLMRSRDPDTASDPGTSDGHVREVAAVRKRRRTRSLPRRRPLKNSAKPPSVKEDLLALQRTYNIDDSTLDDVEAVSLSSVTTPEPAPLPPAQKQQQQKQPSKGEESAEGDEGRSVLGRLLLRSLESTKAVRRGIDRLIIASASMARRSDVDDDDDTSTVRASHEQPNDEMKSNMAKMSVDDDLRLAKSEINGRPRVDEEQDSRYDDKLARSSFYVYDKKKPATDGLCNDKPVQDDDDKRCPSCHSLLPPPSVTYVQIPVPRLYQTRPRFRLTLAGLILFLATFWLLVESSTCARFCRPKSCSSAASCVFSFDDPDFGLALPIKLDQWITGGKGRAVLSRVKEEALDAWADVEDLAMGRSLTDTTRPPSTAGMTVSQKQRLRRRLAKRGITFPGPESRLERPSAEQQARWESWKRFRADKMRARKGRMGGENPVAETVGADERVAG